MVVNLCLPHFQTTIQCNKLCADGYDVTNLLSADPAARRRGFKLEYFLRPPVQVTLQFGFQVEVCRVDVELWPWGMDRGQACKRLEISTNSDPPLIHKQRPEQGLSSGFRMEQQQSHIRRLQHGQGKGQQRDQQGQKLPFQQQHDKEATSKGHHWSQQARQWGQRDQGQHQGQHQSQQGGHSQGQTDNEGIQAEFKLVGRCELRDNTPVCFSHPGFHPRPPFASPPPPLPPNCREEELWSRGLPSLGSVTQLRVTVPFGGAASALGLKALAVWGLPARCCPPEEVENVRNAHQASLRLQLPPATPNHSSSQILSKTKTTTAASLPDIPEEFLDPLTQEVMSLPMLLPSGASVDNTTLEEYQKREAGWGRPPNDPFTGVPYTTDSRPLPNPHLKSRIDRFLLQAGSGVREGVVGRQVESPHPSRLVALKGEGGKEEDQGCKVYPCDPAATESTSHLGVLCVNGGTRTQMRQKILPTGSQEQLRLGKLAGTGTIRVVNESDRATDLHPLGGERGAHSQVRTTKLGSGPKRDRSEDPDPTRSKADSVSTGQPDSQVPESKRSRTDCNSAISSGLSGVSHEQRLSASLDQALLSALQGRPSFTSPSPQHTPASDIQPQTASGEDRCGVCFCSLSAYSSCSPAYRLPCCHFLCRPCLHKKSRPPSSVSTETSKHILCPTCLSPALSSDITLVHH